MIRVEGIGEVIAALTVRAAAIEVATIEATHVATETVQRATRHYLELQSHPRNTPTPSAPGQPPAMVTGNLSDSMHIEGPATVGGRVHARVGPTAVYGRIHELGGIAGNGAHLPARPSLGPALRDSKSAIHAAFHLAWGAAIRG